jgi:signal transduction histidine kinase/BarA-like signal transduction histidine kinase
MKPASVPANERARLEKLLSLNILDTGQDDVFDEITQMVAKIFNVPIALVSLIDDHRQWFKSKYGCEITETPRAIAYCSHAILTDDVMVVEDSLLDERFAHNPLTFEFPNIRFYAGAPLTTSDGYNLGTLCVISDQPRELEGDEAKILKMLAQSVVKEIELRAEVEKNQVITQQLQKYQAEANKAVESKSEFLSVMSHELRTPLNAIIGLTNLLLQDDPKQDQLESLYSLKFSSENLLGLISDILDFSKIESGNLQLEEIDFELRPLMDGIINSLQIKALEKAIYLRLYLEERIPVFLMGDSLRLLQILNNLLSNSLKFTLKGGVDVYVKVLDETDEHIQLEFSVSDTGIGIAPENIDRIFESFTQANHSTTRQFGGTGLGLSITKRLVDLMGSILKVTSIVEKGSVFYFTLWFKKSQRTDASNGTNIRKTVPEGDFNKARVLLVEDDDMNIIVIRKFLNKWNVEPVLCRNGRQALDRLQEGDFDLILMDLQMPEMDGYTASKFIRRLDGVKYKDIPILALTASSLGEVKEQITKAGMNDFVSKPFTPTDLYNKLSYYLPSRIIG